MKTHKFTLNLFLIFVIFSQISCINRGYLEFRTFLHNSSNHYIEVFYYSKGEIDSSLTIKIQNGEEIETNSGMIEDGKVNYFSNTLALCDSALVVFDNKYSKIHYFNCDSVFTSTKPASKSRNIFNLSNYKASMIYKHQFKFIYNFIEQDYFDAQ